MTHIAYYYTGDVSFPGGPKKDAYDLWEVSRQESRLQMPPLVNGMRTTVIYAGKDSWVVNFPRGEALHSVHDEPVSVRSPIFMVRGLARELTELEFGRERDFFTSRNAVILSSSSIAGDVGDVQQLKIGNTTLTMQLGSDGTPEQIEAQAPGVRAAVHYEIYESNLEVVPALFRAPEGVAVKDATQRFILLQSNDPAVKENRH